MGKKRGGGWCLTKAFPEPFCTWFYFEAFTFVKCLIQKKSFGNNFRIKKEFRN